MLSRPMAAVKLFGSHCNQCKDCTRFLELCWCYRKMVFILLISELRGLLCIKNRIDRPFPGGNIFLGEYWMNPGAIGTKMILRVQRF